MNETAFFFKNNTQNIFSVLHTPKETSSKVGWVLCHPFAEEKLWSHRVFVSLARFLSKRGCFVLRFDYRGHGDSDGEFQDISLDDQLSDIYKAVDTLTDKYPDINEIGLIGLRYGATLASIAAESNKKIKNLVLWDPILNLEDYLQELLRVNLTTQMVLHGKIISNRDELTKQILSGESVNIDGYEISKSLYQSAKNINLNQLKKNFPVNVKLSKLVEKSNR